MEFTSCDSSRFRLERLKKAAKIAKAITGLTDAQFDLLVGRMHDAGGLLQVDWALCIPSERQCAAFRDAWKICGESWDAVEHRSSADA